MFNIFCLLFGHKKRIIKTILIRDKYNNVKCFIREDFCKRCGKKIDSPFQYNPKLVNHTTDITKKIRIELDWKDYFVQENEEIDYM